MATKSKIGKSKPTKPTRSVKSIKSSKYPLWEASFLKRPAIRNPTLIVGLPGIGNVGKIVVDMAIEGVGAEKICEFFSYELPHSVFVQESNLVSLPSIGLYFKKIKGHDFVFLSGDAQPMTEQASYQFAELVLDIFQAWKCKEIITLGGIGLSVIPQNPKLYVTGTNEKDVDAFSKSAKGQQLSKQLYGVVGPIMGMSGILVGMAGKRGMKAYCILAETLGHQLYLGLLGARKILAFLSKKYSFDLKLAQLDKEINKFQIQLKNETAVEGQTGKKKPGDVNYIG